MDELGKTARKFLIMLNDTDDWDRNKVIDGGIMMQYQGHTKLVDENKQNAVSRIRIGLNFVLYRCMKS